MRNGNPNQAANPYQTRQYGQAQPGQTNNPSTYGRQVTSGQTQFQPNATGYGGGTNTTGYSRGGGYQQQPVTPLPQVTMPPPAPVYNNPANQAQIDAMWWLKPGAYDHVVPGGNDPNQPYHFANGNVGHMVPPGMTPTPGTGYAYGPSPGFQMPNFGGGNGGFMQQFGGGGNPWASIQNRFGY
jgi:hypothetical protein